MKKGVYLGLIIGMVLTVCLSGCQNTNTKKYSKSDEMNIPGELLNIENDINIKCSEDLILYHQDEKVYKVSEKITYDLSQHKLEQENIDRLNKVIKEVLKTDEDKAIQIKDESQNDKVIFHLEIDLKKVNKNNEILPTLGFYSSHFNDDGTYPLETIQKTLETLEYK